MPPKKKQRTGRDSSAATQEREEEQPSESDAPTEQSEEIQTEPTLIEDKSSDDDPSLPELRDTSKIPQYEYIGIHRPYFDYKIENRITNKHDEIYKWYSKGFDADTRAGAILEPAKDHPEHKWCMIWKGYEMFMDYRRRSKYCSPDNFDMYICNDWEGWGYQELLQNFIAEFDRFIKKTGEDGLKNAWAIVSAMSLWLNEVDQGPLIGNGDGQHTEAVLGMVGHALLRALAALDFAGHLKPDTEFLDVPIVITSLLEFTSGFPEYGLENTAISWRRHAAAYFKKGGFANEKGISSNEKILESAPGGSEADLAERSDRDPWGWKEMLRDYKQSHGTGTGRTRTIGGYKYDITRMSRAKRASYAYDKRDPLADVSDQDLREGNLDFM